MKKVSLKDIATAVGVAPSTVSLILNGKGKEMRISDGLQQKVRKYAETAGYHPNKIAVSLRTGTSKILGLMVEDISNHFFASLAKTIESEAERFGYNVVFCSTENDLTKGKQLLKILNQQQVDGFLITPTPGMCDDIRTLKELNHPLVLMDRHFPELDVPSVMADNYAGVKNAIAHLIERGYKNIGFITVDLDFINITNRHDAYLKALEEAGIPVNPELTLVIPANTAREQSVIAIETFLQGKPMLNAVLFTTNYLGIAGLESIRNLNIAVPQELAVVCFDDHDIFRLHTPPITSISQPIRGIAVEAVQLLMDAIEGRKPQSQNTTLRLSTELIPRRST
jgi:LacI family transcriptional regulator, galactose operon repressor